MASAIVRRGRMVKSVEESLDNNDERGQNQCELSINVTLRRQDEDHSQRMDDNRYSTSDEQQTTTMFHSLTNSPSIQCDGCMLGR
jgi:hypothetical protein